MMARRVLLLAVLLAAASSSAWGQVTISPTTLPAGGGTYRVGQTIAPQQLTTSDPNNFYSWSVISGSTPPGLFLDTDNNPGLFYGTPDQAGAFTFTVQALASEGPSGTRQYTVYVSTGSALSFISSSRPRGAVGKSYATTFQATGGVPGYSYALQGDADGLTLDPSSGRLSGVPVAGGIFPITVVVTDASGAQASTSFNLTVLGITTAVLPDGVVGTPYSQTLAVTGGTGPFIWVLLSGTLPPGLGLDSQGQITGTPTSGGTFPFQVEATDYTFKLSTSKSFSINIVTTPLTVSTSSLPNGTLGVSYSQTLAATGGTPPYVWSATGLPAGLTLGASTGVLSGIPTAAGTQTVAIIVTDAGQGRATANLALTISAPAIGPAALPSGFVNVPYSAPLTVTGNPTAVNWAMASGTLPAGLNLSATSGVISGTPTVAGSSTFTVSATLGAAAAAVSVQKQFTVVIAAAPTLTFTGIPAAAGVQNTITGTISPPINASLSGRMIMTFAPAAGVDDPSVQFVQSGSTTGSRNVAFTIPANTTAVVFTNGTTRISTGTVVGTITITTTLQDSAGTVLTPPAPIVITINPTVPVIRAVTIGPVTTSGFSISVTGFSTPRDMTSAKFHFTSPTNTSLAAADVVVPLTTAFTTWYSNPASNAFGSLFTMTAQFSFTGPPGTTVPFTTVTVTLTNSRGDSNPFGPVSP